MKLRSVPGERFFFPAANRLADLVARRWPSDRWSCPCCERNGSLSPHIAIGGIRRHARCPVCGASERHRLAFHAFEERLAPAFPSRDARVLHFAPESTAAAWLRSLSSTYETADLFMRGVDHQVDITDLPFDDATYDIVWASHVLAVIEDDMQALREIHRILRPGGVAVLPIPILGPTTIDYPEPVPGECMNWHGPGWDYEDRFCAVFDRVEWYRSEHAPERSQTFLYENRSKWPSAAYPYRTPSEGRQHADGIPLCWVD